VFNNPAQCGKAAAVRAVRIKEARLTGHPYDGHGDIQWDASNLTCSRMNRKNLLWACTWAQGKASVKFWATSNGWHTLVTIG
jgi:hypothetical protein